MLEKTPENLLYILYKTRTLVSGTDYTIFFSIISTAISIGCAWGIVSTKVKGLERRMAALEKDHDLLVEIKTKLDLLLEGIARKLK